MKGFPAGIRCLTFAALLASRVGGDPAPQPPLAFAQGLEGTFNADWQGVEGRVYFTQFSTDLVTWHYAPFIDFGGGEHRRGVDSDAEKFFLRLHYGEFPGIDSLDAAMNADFDGDGLSNIFELMAGYDPFAAESSAGGPDATLDPDEDGLGNLSEQAAGSDPMSKDNGLLDLEVLSD